MKSKVLIDFDFNQNEPFIQLNLHRTYESENCSDNTPLDLADKALKSFVEQANIRGIEIIYPEGINTNSSPQIRLRQPNG